MPRHTFLAGEPRALLAETSVVPSAGGGGGGGVARGNVSQNENEKEHLNLPPFWDTLSPLRSLPLWKNSRHITQTNG